MDNSREVLTQEEISALLETVDEKSLPEPEEKSKGVKSLYRKYWKKGSSNIISAKEFDSFDDEDRKRRLLDHASDERYIKSTRVKLKYRLKKTVPFLELLLEYGNGVLKKGDNIELSTLGGEIIIGLFEGFFFERRSFEGGLLIRSGEEAIPVHAENIAVNADGGFIILSRNE